MLDVERVLGDIKIKRAQIYGAEVVERLININKLVFFIAGGLERA